MTGPLDVSHSPFLQRTLSTIEELAALVAAAAPDEPTVEAARDRAAVATLRLDGSPITDVPQRLDELDPGLLPVEATGPARGGWLEVLRSGAADLETLPDEALLAVEHHGARAGLDSLDLAAGLRTDPIAALTVLHRRVTDGLLTDEVAGRLRRTDQAVHDASLGRIIFFPVDQAHIGPRLEALAAWLAQDDGHPVVAAGIVHHQLLDIHPWEAANGRVARIAARLLLAADGIDPEVVAQPEEALLADSIGYLDEVGRSRRLGDPTPFVTRWAEAVADGLLSTARSLGALGDVDVPDATAAFVADRAAGAAAFTIADHRAEHGGAPATADDDLDASWRAGLVRRIPGSQGLRWHAVRTSASSDGAPPTGD